eukprot:CAMPEP_0171059256 /NCGR_PEP_ID=MMETSP0766_2-20121228/3078_1 /TAXON_ID=439317 /ORGANISM="Gambierdiscus australes, Strain CAWD 149" /LENGTH=136 /DNA_ID=CAMNT_0011514679 /DNA_START=49 /DNA_END=457 /DNA_ORIENTATION=-
MAGALLRSLLAALVLPTACATRLSQRRQPGSLGQPQQPSDSSDHTQALAAVRTLPDGLDSFAQLGRKDHLDSESSTQTRRKYRKVHRFPKASVALVQTEEVTSAMTTTEAAPAPQCPNEGAAVARLAVVLAAAALA